MTAGKTRIGRMLGTALGWRFIDVDAEIERRTGRTVARIFQEDGEPAFRLLESEATIEALQQDEGVIASGGGWAARPGAIEGVPGGTLVIWLRIPAREAVRRARRGRPRPLLDRPDPLATARALLAEREPNYRRAHWTIDVEGREPAAIVEDIMQRMKQLHGR